MFKKITVTFLSIILLLVACSPQQATEAPLESAQETPVVEEPAEEKPTLVPTFTSPPERDEEAYPAPTPVVYPPPTDGSTNPDPSGSGYPAPVSIAAPQPITFEAEDGTVLAGTYYAPVNVPAPIVVLMHQFDSDQSQWTDIALWLQSGLPGHAEWLPPLSDGLSFAVLTFDFRGHGESEGNANIDAGLLMDAQAAVKTAQAQPGVDPNRTITIGTSIGADAAIDACINLDGDQVASTQEVNSCVGVMSLSPGSFLGVDYTAAGNAFLGDPQFGVVYCIASENDGDSPDACNSLTGNGLHMVIYPGGAHGQDLLTAGLDPDMGTLILEFLMKSLQLRQ